MRGWWCITGYEPSLDPEVSASWRWFADQDSAPPMWESLPLEGAAPPAPLSPPSPSRSQPPSPFAAVYPATAVSPFIMTMPQIKVIVLDQID